MKNVFKFFLHILNTAYTIELTNSKLKTNFEKKLCIWQAGGWSNGWFKIKKIK